MSDALAADTRSARVVCDRAGVRWADLALLAALVGLVRPLHYNGND